jgi:hypothetical protein
VLAAWTADLISPLVRRLEHRLGGRRAAAGALSVAVVLAIAVPLFGAVTVMAFRARDLVLSALQVLGANGALSRVLGASSTDAPLSLPSLRDPGAVLEWLRQNGATAWHVASSVAARVAAAYGEGVERHHEDHGAEPTRGWSVTRHSIAARPTASWRPSARPAAG